MPPVESRRVSTQKPFHAGDRIALRRLDHQVKIIGHEDVSIDLPVGLAASLANGFDEALAIRIVLDDRIGAGRRDS